MCSSSAARKSAEAKWSLSAGLPGSGKSTLIKCVNGLEAFQKGEILVDGLSWSPENQSIQTSRAGWDGLPAF